jgi:exonuclease SbcD
MRFLHTGDWHLGRAIGGQPRIDECARVLDEVVAIAKQEHIDAMLIAGDTFDTFSPPSDAQRLLFETLSRLARDGVKVALIAGNHDSAPRIDALATILEIASVYVVGALPADEAYAPLRIASRDGSETATIAAVPWIPEHLTVRYDAIFGPADEALSQYAANMERALKFYSSRFTPGEINILLGHMMIDGTSIGEGSGERRLHIGNTFAVPGHLLPATAQYIALGHVHRPQEVANSPVAGGSFYAGSLLQLDFGEAEQKKSVRVVDIKPRLPADSRAVSITTGTGLRNVRLRLEDLASHSGRYGDDYLRVFVELDGPVKSLFDQVHEVLPNAISVMPVRTDEPQSPATAPRQGLEPHELISRYYRESHASEMPAELVTLFNQLYDEEVERASA